MVAPTLRDRLPALDVLRGVAILGILLANIAAFSEPYASAMVSSTPLAREGVDGWLQAAVHAFVTGKFRSMLSVLFGVGLWLQFQKRSAIPGNWPGGYLKRMSILALLGIAHGVLIWFGDILFTYALVGFIGCLLVGMSPRAVRGLCIVMFSLSALFGILLATISGLAAGQEGPFAATFNATNEIRIHAGGSWLEQLGFRATMFALSGASTPFLALFLLPLFLIGVQLGRQGVLSSPKDHPRAIRRMLLVGFGIGLPVNLLAFAAHATGYGDRWGMVAEFIGGPLMAPGYLAIGAVAIERVRGGALRGALSAVGRTALSCYILQSIICTFVFYSWGLGLFGRLAYWQAMLIVPAVWTANVAFATLWLRRFDIGPIEWAWRSMTEGRRQPWRARDVPVTPHPGFHL